MLGEGDRAHEESSLFKVKGEKIPQEREIINKVIAKNMSDLVTKCSGDFGMNCCSGLGQRQVLLLSHWHLC